MMPDIEKVIKGLAHCTRPSEVGKGGNFCIDCPYTEPIGFNQFKCNSQQMMKDALALIKEQEDEVKQVDLYGKDEWWGLVCVCPDCKAEWMSDKGDTHFCPKCGRQVKWE